MSNIKNIKIDDYLIFNTYNGKTTNSNLLFDDYIKSFENIKTNALSFLVPKSEPYNFIKSIKLVLNIYVDNSNLVLQFGYNLEKDVFVKDLKYTEFKFDYGTSTRELIIKEGKIVIFFQIMNR